MMTHLFESRQDMLKIPLKMVNMAAFPDHGLRFLKILAFYITVDDTNAVNETTCKNVVS